MTELGRGFFPSPVAVDADNSALYLADPDTGSVLRADLLEGSAPVAVENTAGLAPCDLSVDASGAVYAASPAVEGRLSPGARRGAATTVYRLAFPPGGGSGGGGDGDGSGSSAPPPPAAVVSVVVNSTALLSPPGSASAAPPWCFAEADQAGAVLVPAADPPSSVVRLDAATGDPLGSFPFFWPMSLASPAAGDYFFALVGSGQTGVQNSLVYRVHRESGAAAPLGPGFPVADYPSAIAADGAGNVYVAAWNAVWRMNGTTGGDRVALASGFGWLADIAVDRSGENVYVVDYGWRGGGAPGAVLLLQPPGAAAPPPPPWPPREPPPWTGPVGCGEQNWTSAWTADGYLPRSTSCQLFLCAGASIRVGASLFLCRAAALGCCHHR